MIDVWQKFFQDIGSPDFDTGGIDTGVAAQIFLGRQFTINKQADMVVGIIHESQDCH